jgi:hypothetical protein
MSRFAICNWKNLESYLRFRRLGHSGQGATPRGLHRRLRSQFAMLNRRATTAMWRTSRRCWKSSAQRLVQPMSGDVVRRVEEEALEKCRRNNRDAGANAARWAP